MSDTWGNRIKLSIFGESHGPAIGITIDGLPPGLAINMSQVEQEMARRAPGKSPFATARQEADTVEILSGMHEGKTTGTAICGIIRNKDARSKDYGTIPRPGHADLTAAMRYQGHADMRGGGHFSGRLTAPLVFAGALAKQALSSLGISIYGRIKQIGTISDPITDPAPELWTALTGQEFPALNAASGKAMQELILNCRNQLDSVGGVVETAAFGVPGGLGDPFFASVESVAAAIFFSIPAVKGIEFGDGFSLAAMQGSQANDAIGIEDRQLTTKTNRCGGILGGITTGQPVIARLAFKPTPSIAQPQESADPVSLEPATLEIKGRHDPCIVPRAVPVAEAALALAILDCLPEGTLFDHRKEK